MTHDPSAAAAADRMRRTFDLFESVTKLMRDHFRFQNPGASEKEIDQMMGQWFRDQPTPPGHVIVWPMPLHGMDDYSD